MDLLFKHKHKIEPRQAVNQPEVHAEKRHLTKELLKIQRSADTITVEAVKMKKRLDTAIRIAQATGGIR